MSFAAPDGATWELLGVALAIVIGPQVATRLRLPPIIGLLAGGLVIGPQVLGIVPTTDTLVSALGQLGLLYLMFSAGVELDLPLFRRFRRAAVTFGLMTFTAPMVLGVSAGLVLDYSWAAALLLGSVWASHTLVTYPMVRQAGLSGNRAVATTVGATVITDTMSLVVLAGVSGSVEGESSLVQVIASLLIGLAGLGLYAGWALPRVARWFFVGPGQDGVARYVFLLAALLSTAVLAEVVGIEGIVGAFFAGLGLNRFVPAASRLMERVEFFGSALLIPVFLVSVGVLIEPSVVVQPSTLGLAAVFFGAVGGGKAIAALLARPVLGFTAGESGLMFGMTLSQAAATLASTMVGFNIGLFGEQVVNAVLVVIMVTLLLAALATARAMKSVEPTPSDSVELGRSVVLVPARQDRLDALAAVGGALVAPEGGVVVPMRVSRCAADLEGDRPFLGVVEAVLAKAGLESLARLRVDTDPIEAVAAVTIEEAGTLVLVDWQASARHQAALEGGRDDDLLGATPVPVVFATLSDTAVTRVVLALDGCDLGEDRAVDVALAVEIAARVAGADHGRVALVPEGSDGQDSDGVVERFVAADAAQRSSLGRLAWLRENVQPGDLVVLPAHPQWAHLGPSAVRTAAQAGVSLLVAADAPRWTDPLAGSEQVLGALVGASTGPPIRWG